LQETAVEQDSRDRQRNVSTTHDILIGFQIFDNLKRFLLARPHMDSLAGKLLQMCAGL
jgi:hypothetical protein